MRISPDMEKEFTNISVEMNFTEDQNKNMWQFYKKVREGSVSKFPETTMFARVYNLACVHNLQESKADARQAGGDHYKKLKVQPWDAMEAWLTQEEFRGFLKGNIIKYLARANSGKEDHNLMIEKAAHYQQKLDEMIVKWKSS